MPLINPKIERKLKWTKYCVLTAAGPDNIDTNPNNITFTIKGKIISSSSNFISKIQSKIIKTSQQRI